MAMLLNLKTWYQLFVDNFLTMVSVAFVAAALRRAWPVSIDDLAGSLRAVPPVRILTAVILTAGVAQPWSTRRASASQSGCLTADRSLDAAREETQDVIFSAVDEVFARTSVRPEEIDVLIVNCSIFTPTPVFVDMVVNRYKLRPDVQSLNLSGMGCGAGLVNIGLARHLLQVAPPGTHVLTVSTEILSSQYYIGSERAMLLPNCLFRMGAAATILSNLPERARFRLGRIVRRMTAARDADYHCIFQEEDGKGILGVRLSKDLTTTAGQALKRNIMAFGPLVLPVSEQLLVALSLLKRKLLSCWGAKVRLYRLDFHTAFEHFCIHAGGRGVIDEVQRGLGLSDENVEASRMTLHRFGNTSRSSVLYELAYIEAKGCMRKGDHVWMISFGSGFNCSSVAWECLKAAIDSDGPWADCIHRYPVQLPEVALQDI
ncbi:unnamed protein product [Miscanthus lutarioriparius]|uniref:3-ketoacyl-CoA synthase n=1 Tax=Miscanthus lutarioriparius TaxID=422564 RepID=A0A811PBW9_9POAL|nr:unnamed protein product [Miscanthus lutarioriparius]